MRNLRSLDSESREVIEIIHDVVKATSEGLTIAVPDGKDGFVEIKNPAVNYIFGNSQYFKDSLDEQSKTPEGREMKFPVIALSCPVIEDRNDPQYYTKAKLSIIIGCGTLQQYSNAQRLFTSFKRCLRPVYRRFLQALSEDHRIDIGYEELIRHRYSENYSYGRYGALTPSGERVSEPIDAIDISNLEIKVKLPNCR